MRYFLFTGTALKTPPRRQRISQVISVSRTLFSMETGRRQSGRGRIRHNLRYSSLIAYIDGMIDGAG
jgi:hypothetical protein